MVFKKLLDVVDEVLRDKSDKYKTFRFDQQRECAIAVTSDLVRRKLSRTDTWDRYAMLEKQIVTIGKERGL
uniref:Uncharacterized protein n=1 Tax=viral metagenome TaxID=1070528 RepID=A0A6H1ZAM6_9ZZZZ